jgi:hypothetical protein
VSIIQEFVQNLTETQLKKQGCQMSYFQTKNPNLGKFWRVLQWKMLVYFMAIWSNLWQFCIFYDHLVYFVLILYILSRFGMLRQEKSGNPGLKTFRLMRQIGFNH